MKKLKLIIYLILPILLMASKCNEKNKEPNVMKGRLMYNCTVPASNVKVLLKTEGNKTVEMIDGSKELFTDEEGYFEFQFHRKANKYVLYAPYKTMANIPDKKYLDLGEIQLERTYNCYIRLDVQNPYSDNDTLIYADWSSLPVQTIRIPGPFQSGIIDTMISVPHEATGGWEVLRYGGLPQLSIAYAINPYNGIHGRGESFFTPCSSEIYEVVFKIQ